jgi:hypothetical protein
VRLIDLVRGSWLVTRDSRMERTGSQIKEFWVWAPDNEFLGSSLRFEGLTEPLKNVCSIVYFILKCYTVYKSESEKKMSVNFKTNSFFGSLAGRILSIFGRPPTRPTAGDLRRMEFKTSTQRLGVRFTEKIRQIFRFRWLRKF